MHRHLFTPELLLHNVSHRFPPLLLPLDTEYDPDEPVRVPEPFPLTPAHTPALCDVLSSLTAAVIRTTVRRHPHGYDIACLTLPLPALHRHLSAVRQTRPQSPAGQLATLLWSDIPGWQRDGATQVQCQLPQRHVTLSVQAQIWGHEDAAPPPALLRRTHRLTGGRCDICGHTSKQNVLRFRDGSPENRADLNLGMACSLCSLSQHLNRLDAAAGVMVYLPAMPPADLSHLLRAVLTARLSGDARQKADAGKVLAWLISHRAECERFWGTSHPGEFGEALLRAAPATRDDLQQRLRHVMLVPNPAVFSDPAGLA